MEYGFPFEPYPSQVELVRGIGDVLSSGGVGIFEAPTGTGKTMSLLVSGAKWLEENKLRIVTEQCRPLGSLMAPAWVRQKSDAMAEERARALIEAREESIEDCNIRDAHLLPPTPAIPRVFILSRTHSQLRQFISEFRLLTKYPTTRISLLGSRKQMCVHPGAATARGGYDAFCRNLESCPYNANTKTLTAAIAKEPLDIEDLKGAGLACKACPYYASYAALNFSDIVLAPYTSFFADRVDLPNGQTPHVVFVDEAHNLPEALWTATGAKLTQAQIRDTSEDALEYSEASGNRQLRTLSVLLEKIASSINELDGPMGITEFLISSELESANIPLLLQACDDHKLAVKVRRVSERKQKGSWIMQCLEFLKKINTSGPKDKIVISKESNVELVSFGAAEFVEQFLKACRSVVMVGGTLTPMDELLALVGGAQTKTVDEENKENAVGRRGIKTLSVGQYQLADQAVCGIIHEDSKGRDMTFTYERRGDGIEGIIELMGHIQTNLDYGGVLFFFPSAVYMKEVHAKLPSHFSVCMQNNETSDIVISDFESRVETKSNPVFLFSPIGGSFSEGVNFKDDLARLVVVIGLPHAPPSHLLSVKLESVRQKYGWSEQHYRSLQCFKAVNQAVGRGIRHRNDFAAIVLFDSRYRDGVLASLPTWLKSAPTQIMAIQDVSHACKWIKERRQAK